MDEGQDYDQNEYDNEDEDPVYEISENVLRQLIYQHQRREAGEDPGEPIYDDNGQPIVLSDDELQQAIAQLHQH